MAGLLFVKLSSLNCVCFGINEASLEIDEDAESLPLSGNLLGRSKGLKAGRPIGLLSC